MADPKDIKDLPATVTHYAQLKDGEYLGHWNLPEDGSKIKATIDKVNLENVMNPASYKKEWKSVMSFVGGKKRLILNATNLKAIASWHGNDPHKWNGKEIHMFRTLTNLKGETVECIRIQANDKKRVADRSSQSKDALK